MFQQRPFLSPTRLLCTVLVGILLTPALLAGDTLPAWVGLNDGQTGLLELSVPADLKKTPPDRADLTHIIVRVDADWRPDWKQAAFDLKALIVAAKAKSQRAQVGIHASEAQLNGLMQHETAAYIDGYLFDEDPFIPDADDTGRLWQEVDVPTTQVLTTLVEASSLSINTVVFKNLNLSPAHQRFLEAIDALDTGSLDTQPTFANMPAEEALLFLNPGSGDYQLAVYGDAEADRLFSFRLVEGLEVSLLHPENGDYRHKSYGTLQEFFLAKGEHYYLFQLRPASPGPTLETLKIVEAKSVDPYELVVRNQVFKDAESKKFSSMEALEKKNYRYQGPSGATIDVTFYEDLIMRADQPTERIRRALYFGGVKWPYEKLPDLPLIEPDKLDKEPLQIDLDKSYEYTYAGEDTIDGAKTWRVRFKPKGEGDFFTGTVWIDQETGAHRRLRATQSGLEPPVIGNETTAFFDWVAVDGTRYWVQVREENLQVLSVVGETIPLQVETRRENFRFDQEDLETRLAQAYLEDWVILRDTAQGFRYLKKKDGRREVVQETTPPQRFLLGGVLMDPNFDFPLPLGGFNYIDLDFLDRGWQANFFVAGLVNDAIISNPDFLGRGWDLTAELFVSAIKFGDEVYQGDEEIEEEEVQSLNQSFNLTLGIPINSFFKFSANYAVATRSYDTADDTAEAFVLPSDHLEHSGTLGLTFNRGRFVSALAYSTATRSEWETWGLPDNTDPLEDTWSTLQFDASYSHRFKGFHSVQADVRYLKGWDQDRFSRFDFGFFENSVSGFGSSGIEADEAVRLRLGYDLGVAELIQLGFSLDGARTWRDEFLADGSVVRADPVDLYGIGVSVNFIGPWRTVLRANVGYGIDADLEDEAGDFTGQILFLKIF
ncbi:hypothetical protein [Acanthopleuribacter pedis]|uniref:Uncharacterized protein n=1 Tax=Acanthopleuribacter pedis TaxID=442870 RepID=A0A8J7U6H5_9BACT|nr:hypothetical protein [Acanthopleuribacter pedis]MBO1320376.1 hypothetical protein [Acanthopleuribacter pedis]